VGGDCDSFEDTVLWAGSAVRGVDVTPAPVASNAWIFNAGK
jgi:hypothetical protein